MIRTKSLISLFVLTAFLLALSGYTRSQETLAAHIAPKILRFHVLADSNRREDQELKLQVRDQVLSYIYTAIPQPMEKEPLKRWLADHAEQIEETAEGYLASQGHPQEVSFELTSDYFPTKAYGDMVFPCGTYDAARITIGSGKGRNWWCVLYPSLCFTDPVTARVPEPSKKKLSALLDETDYEALRAEEKPEIHVRLRLLDTVSALLSH